jgi:hypothetical protein
MAIAAPFMVWHYTVRLGQLPDFALVDMGTEQARLKAVIR